MSIIGVDFGSHTCSLALWTEEKNSVEVIADDMGSRTIPCAVAFRNGEVIVGQAAMSQQHKNPSNTFEDIRSLLLNPDITNVFVPILEKEITIQELASHFFRNIHNQIKQQVGKVVRDCVIVTPLIASEEIKQRVSEAAQAGGVRVKCFANDSSSALIAYGLDDSSFVFSRVAVIDIGWVKSEVSVYEVSGGLFFPLSTASSTEICGKVLVKLLSEHCAKDFQRKAKMSCMDSSKSMMRLRRECEEAMKHLSTGAEATIDIDSLFEGVDFSTKITRARFEDLASIPILYLKNLVASTLAASSDSLGAADITHVCVSGGLSAMPRVISTIKTIFASAEFMKARFEPFETACIGATLHGKFLIQQGLIESVPQGECGPVACISQTIFLSSGSTVSEIVPVYSVLPLRKVVSATVGQPKGFFTLLTGTTPIGEVAFDTPESSSVDVVLDIEETGAISMKVQAVGCDGAVLAVLDLSVA